MPDSVSDSRMWYSMPPSQPAQLMEEIGFSPIEASFLWQTPPYYHPPSLPSPFSEATISPLFLASPSLCLSACSPPHPCGGEEGGAQMLLVSWHFVLAWKKNRKEGSTLHWEAGSAQCEGQILAVMSFALTGRKWCGRPGSKCVYQCVCARACVCLVVWSAGRGRLNEACLVGLDGERKPAPAVTTGLQCYSL